MKTCQKHEIESNHININNEDTIILYDNKSAVSYISLDCQLRFFKKHSKKQASSEKTTKT